MTCEAGGPRDGLVPAASVIVRTKDSARTVMATLESLSAQSVRAEVIVVDSGSTDDTLMLVSDRVDRVIHLAAERFSYGRALNAGAAVATAAVHVALSSHCVLPRPDWLEIAVASLGDPTVVGTCSADVDGEGRPVAGPLRATHEQLLANPFWGFTNHASAWSAAAWARAPFDEELGACEDREWSWRATDPDGAVVLDPRLYVPVSHRRAAGLLAYHARLLREVGAYAELGLLPAYPLRRAVRDLVVRVPAGPFLNGSNAGGRTRLVEVAARWQAGRR